MNKKEVAEIKRRLKKDTSTISRIVGCYVNSSKDKVCTFNENFLNMQDEELQILRDCKQDIIRNSRQQSDRISISHRSRRAWFASAKSYGT